MLPGQTRLIMKKRILSPLLLITVLLSSFSLDAFAAGNSCDCANAPIIYVRGRTDILLDKDQAPDAEGNYTLPKTDDIDVMELAKQVVPMYCMDYLKDDFSEFTQFVCDWADEVFGGFALDQNGCLTNNSGIRRSLRWRENRLTDRHKPGGEVTTPKEASAELYKYDYHYDYRLDPLETADDLHD